MENSEINKLNIAQKSLCKKKQKKNEFVEFSRISRQLRDFLPLKMIK